MTATIFAFIAIWLVLVLMYTAAMGVLAIGRRRSAGLCRKTDAFWSRELAITTWILASPGLAAAAYGIGIGIGLVLLPLGIAIGVVATRASAGRRTRVHLLPLITVGTIDAFVVADFQDAMKSHNEYVYANSIGVATWAVIFAYFGIATLNAIRIYLRGRANSKERATARAGEAGPVARNVVDECASPELDARPLIGERRQE